MSLLKYRLMSSPIGTLTLVVNERGALTHILFEGDQPPPGAIADPTCADAAAKQLDEYFSGERQRFDLELEASGTEFRKKVWTALMEIPFGETRSYSQIAVAVGNPVATRAVGAANGANPIPIVVPCHRVIGADGSLTGFGGGLSTKKMLLELEGVIQPAML